MQVTIFRLHTASTLDNESEEIRIQSFGSGITGWQTHNPIKVKINSTGKLEHVKEHA